MFAVMLKKEEVTQSKTIYEGRVVKLRLDNVVSCNNKTVLREIVEHPNGVGVVAIDNDNKIYLVRQYRNPFEDFILEIPAGKAEPGESAQETAKRELREETGYSAENMMYLGNILVSPGFCNEKVHIFLAQGLTKGQCDFDDDEYVELEVYDFDDAYKMVMEAKITDAKTVVGILKAKEILKNN